MIRVFVATKLAGQSFKFDYMHEALGFATKIGALVDCDVSIFVDDSIVGRQSWYNGYVQHGSKEEFCVVMDVDSSRFNHWGYIKERTHDRACVSFKPGSGMWFDVADLEIHSWDDTPERIRDIHFGG